MGKKTKIRVLSLLLALSIVLGMSPGAVWAAEGSLEGDGTPGNPYLIADAKDLTAFRELVNGSDNNASYAKLTSDINLNHNAWTPFSSKSNYPTTAYAGTFDGGGHTISGLKIDSKASYQGLFGAINGAVIKNLKVDGSVSSSGNYVGGIVGKIQQGTVENCSFTGNVAATSSRGYAGGIAGYAGNSSSQTAAISGCANLGSVTGAASGVAGGIVGYAKYTAIENCYNTGAVNGASRSGGIAGQLQNQCTAAKCYNIGVITGSATANDICDFIYTSSSTSDCYGKSEKKETLLDKLGASFTADTHNINGGWPILTWQAGSVPVPTNPEITVAGTAELYDTNSGETPSSLLRVIYRDLEPLNITWSLTRGEGVVELVRPDNPDGNNSAVLVRALAPGRAAVRAEAGDYSDELEITVYPFITTVDIAGAAAAEQTVRAKINVLGGRELDYEIFPVSITWKYLTAEDYLAGNTGSSHYKLISGAAGLTYTIPRELAGCYLSFDLRYNGETKNPSHPREIQAEAPEQPGPRPPAPDQTLEQALDGYTMYPVSGRDRNVNQVLEEYLTQIGFEGYTARVKSVETVYSGAEIAPNGGITYFYADPNTAPAVKMGSFKVTFALSKGEKTLETEIPVILYWDTERVKEAVRREISGKVSLPSGAVTENLSLPKTVDGKKWTLISWQSSDETVISISRENQSSAGTLFVPYTGVVKRGEQDRQVILTALYTFQLTNDITGRETPITLSNFYPVTVKALDQADKEAIQARLQAKLDAGFASRGLTDGATGRRLVPDGAGIFTSANDIQLPTTQDFGVDGKHYPITISTSSSAVLKVPAGNNAARVEVFRPAAGEPDAVETITVTLHDRDTSITASRTWKIRVPALTQEEIDRELALMEQVKAAYFEGMKGGNDAKNNVRTHLSPFFEAYEQDGALVWVRSAEEKTGRGIVPVPMEGWEDLELWRLFKSSNPNVISHENLLVTRQQEAKAVTVTSRLSSQTLGRYGELYAKHPEDYPQYAALAPLYYQEVSTSVSAPPAGRQGRQTAAQFPADTIVVRGTRNPDSPIPVPQTADNVTFSLTGLDGAPWISASFTGLDESSTVYDVFVKALGSSYTAGRVKGTYIKDISGPLGRLEEKEHGEYSGWMYRVNGRTPDVYMGACPLHSGDVIQVFYTRDARKEDPNWNRPAGGSGSSSGGSSSGSRPAESGSQAVQVERAGGENTYRITLPKGSGGPRLVTIPEAKQGQLVAVIHSGGREEVIKKSILEGGHAKFLLEQDADVKLVDYTNSFEDVSSAAWYSSAVDFAAGRGLFSGTSQNTFAPDLPLSRGMLAAVLYRLEEPDALNTASPFTDVASGSWYETGAAWAANSGIVSGYGDGRFGPNDSVTREQLAVILFRYAQLLDMSTGGRDSLTGYADSGRISPWARDAVAWAVDSGIISGTSTSTLAPLGKATRAEACAMLQRFVCLLLK